MESLSIEEPVELRPPQYALVTFGTLETVLLILDGKEKVQVCDRRETFMGSKICAKEAAEGQKQGLDVTE